MKKLQLIILFALVLGLQAQAQKKDSIKVTEINIIRAFEPEVNLVSKVDLPPDMQKAEDNNPSLLQKYTFNDYFSAINYTPEDLKPVMYRQPVITNESLGYLRLGMGNYLTPVVDFQIENKLQEKYRAGLNLNFIHSKANKTPFKKYFNLGTDAYAEYYMNKMTIGARFSYDMDQYYLYGMEKDKTETLDKKDVSRKYTTPEFEIYFINNANRFGIDISGSLGVELANTDFGNKGTNVNYSLHGAKQLLDNSYEIGLNIDGQHSNSKTRTDNFIGNALSLKPYAAVHKSIWDFELGLVFMYNYGKVYVLPSIKNQIKLKDDILVMYNEWNSGLKYNNLVEVEKVNPFISNDVVFSNYRFQERTFIGLRGSMTNGIHYDARFSQLVWNDAPLFVNDTGDFKQFVQVYDKKIKALNPHIELGYGNKGLFDVKLGFDYFKYSTENEVAAWHKPEFQLTLAGKYFWKDKLTVGAEIVSMGGIKVRNAALEVEKLKTQFDLNFSASYQIVNNFSAFVELNNALNNTAARWNMYDRYGFHGIGGIKFVF
ncbi:MAG: hypothetical protein M9887_08870 [Chitinophagales bacterium]|nr:hypothetical protein [Chitinophagales bacterium]